MRELESLSELKFVLPRTEAEMLELVKDARAIVQGNFPLTRKIIDTTENLRLIAKAGIGYDDIDVAAATDKKILVTNVPKVLSDAVAEHAMLLMLAVSRRLPLADKLARTDAWGEFFTQRPMDDLEGKTLGLVGLGAIGYAVGRRAKAFGMKILFFDPYVDRKKAEELEARRTDLGELLRESDVISLHTPLTNETKSLIGKREFDLMKKSAILINTARGAVVDETSLINALRSGSIAGAGLDVMTMEPPEATNSLLSMDNVVVTPHCASFTLQGAKRLWFACADAVIRVLRGELPQSPANILNREAIQ